MKKLFKNSIFTFILGAIIFGGIGVLATVVATGITYEPSWTKVNGDPITNVQEALDTLYTKATTPKVATQVATLTTRGATYTMENDGYITGTVQASGGGSFVYFNGTDTSNIVYYTNYTDTTVYNASIFAPKGTVVSTRANYGNYNLTVYEWK